jgi:hypothetical protein
VEQQNGGYAKSVFSLPVLHRKKQQQILDTGM